MKPRKYGDWAFITGASSGIGEEFARQLAEQEWNLVLVARSEDKLLSLAAELKSKHDIETICIPLDLSYPDWITVIEKHTNEISIGILINNAGFTISENFLKSDIDQQIKLIDVNIKVLTMLTHHFANKMKSIGKGGIINVASASAYLPIANWSVYAASKSYVLSFSEALWYEFKNTGVEILALCPGATKTAFNNAANEKNGMNVSGVVSIGLNTLGKYPSVIAGAKNKFLVWVLKFLGSNAKISLGAKIVAIK